MSRLDGLSDFNCHHHIGKPHTTSGQLECSRPCPIQPFFTPHPPEERPPPVSALSACTTPPQRPSILAFYRVPTPYVLYLLARQPSTISLILCDGWALRVSLLLTPSWKQRELILLPSHWISLRELQKSYEICRLETFDLPRKHGCFSPPRTSLAGTRPRTRKSTASQQPASLIC